MTGGHLSAMNAPTPVPQILLVEDDHLTASCIREFLSDLGFIVLGSASSAFEAMGFAEACPPDVAVVDIGLNGPIDGIQLAENLSGRYSVPVVFISGVTDRQTIARAEAACPSTFLKKPVPPSTLLAAIEKALAPTPMERSVAVVSPVLDVVAALEEPSAFTSGRKKYDPPIVEVQVLP